MRLFFFVVNYILISLGNKKDGGEIVFKLKETTSLHKLMGAYSSRLGVTPSTVRFLYNGQRIQDEDTPQKVCKFKKKTSYNFKIFIYQFPF